MSKCGHCGAQTTRIRTKFVGTATEDECPYCAPQTFGAIKDPSTQKMWIGPEYNPNAYEKRYDERGDAYYVAKPEFTAEQESKVAQGSTDENEARAIAEEHKRKTRRTTPMTADEFRSAMKRAGLYAELFKRVEDAGNA